jgi:hypothetical protein
MVQNFQTFIHLFQVNLRMSSIGSLQYYHSRDGLIKTFVFLPYAHQVRLIKFLFISPYIFLPYAFPFLPLGSLGALGAFGALEDLRLQPSSSVSLRALSFLNLWCLGCLWCFGGLEAATFIFSPQLTIPLFFLNL